MAIVISQPEAVFPAFSRARLVLNPTSEETEVVLTIATFSPFYEVAFKREFFLENEDIGPVAVFDLGEIARQFLFDRMDEINAETNSEQGYTAAFIDRRLSAKFSVSLPDGPSLTFLAVNAAAAPGGSTLVWGGHVGYALQYQILTSMPSLLFYSGFTDKSFMYCYVPTLEPGARALFGVINGGVTMLTTSDIDGGVGRVVAIKIPPVSDSFPLRPERISAFVLDPDFTGLYRDIEWRCVPQAPFYVRWINRLGGRDHWMFSRKSVLQEQIDDEVFYEPFSEWNEQAGQGQHVVSLSAERVVTVGDEGIETAYFTPLKDVITSPLVEYYDEEVGKWLTVRVKDGRTTLNREDSLHGIELKFVLPTKDLQF